MSVSVMFAVLLVLSQAPASAPTPVPPPSRPEIAAEVERGTKAYNAQDLAYYQAALMPDTVYIADTRASFTGEGTFQLFTRILPAPEGTLEVADVVTGGQGDAPGPGPTDAERHSGPGPEAPSSSSSGGIWQVPIRTTPGPRDSPRASLGLRLAQHHH